MSEPTIAQLQAQVAALTERLSAVERATQSPAPAALSAADMSALVAQVRTEFLLEINRGGSLAHAIGRLAPPCDLPPLTTR